MISNTSLVQLSSFKSRLKTCMIRANISTPAEFGELTGLSSQVIWAYLRGVRYPTAYSVVRIAKATNVSCDWLLGFDVPIDRVE